jgi:hypothetical protein
VITGEVRSVERGGSQTELVAAAPAGATTLAVEMAEGNFNEDGGQPMQVAIELRGDRYEAVSQPFREASFDGGAVWNPHSFRDMAAATIPNNLSVDITAWGNGETDGVTAWAGGYTIQYPGVYFMSVLVGFVANSTGRRRVHIHLNGLQVAFAASTADPSANTFVSTFRQMRLAELDVITVQVSQDAGAGLPLLVANGESTFAMHRVSV